MAWDVEETIVAAASPPGIGARGIVRVSGPSAVPCVASVFVQDAPGRPFTSRAASRHAGRVLLLPDQAPLPCEVQVWPGTQSYTRQPTVEIHTVASLPLLGQLVETLSAAGARLARPGEFTLRAFLAGRLDLTQAEGVLGVIDARDGRELEGALSQLAGGLSQPLSLLRESLIDLLAEIEAGLDFVEEDLELISADDATGHIDQAARVVAALVQQLQIRRVRPGHVRIVLAGAPNVGKSSLFNALVGHSAALVDEASGTTRDYLSVRTEIDGRECELVDTAGLSADADLPQAQTAAQAQQARADLLVACVDSSRRSSAEGENLIRSADASMRVIVLTKCDLPQRSGEVRADCRTSSRTGEGLDELRRLLARKVAELEESPVHEVLGGGFVEQTALRVAVSLAGARDALERARAIVGDRAGDELLAVELRHALDELGRVTGAVYTDDVLDRVFGKFCIGK
jgi:tRNA modification GTPase